MFGAIRVQSDQHFGFEKSLAMMLRSICRTMPQIESDSKKQLRVLMKSLMPCDCMARTQSTTLLSFSERQIGFSVMSECSVRECTSMSQLSLSGTKPGCWSFRNSGSSCKAIGSESAKLWSMRSDDLVMHLSAHFMKTVLSILLSPVSPCF